MNEILLAAHSGWRYVVLFIALVAVVKYLIGWIGHGLWSQWDQRLGATVPIVYDIQLLLGLVLWIMISAWQLPARQAWEHPFTMLAGLIVAHLTWLAIRRQNTDVARFRTALLGYLLALVIISIGVWRITIG
jgi:hypothetical protein